jgi:hypothetical protein
MSVYQRGEGGRLRAGINPGYPTSRPLDPNGGGIRVSPHGFITKLSDILKIDARDEIMAVYRTKYKDPNTGEIVDSQVWWYDFFRAEALFQIDGTRPGSLQANTANATLAAAAIASAFGSSSGFRGNPGEVGA